MFSLQHVAISVSNLEKSLNFYKFFGFEKFKSWSDEDKSIQIEYLKLENQILELFCYKNYTELPKTALNSSTDLSVIGVKHFAFGIDDINKAKNFVMKNKLAKDIDIKIGRLGNPYFFINDPDGILVEFREND